MLQDCKAAAITPSKNAAKKSSSMSFSYFNKGKPAGTASCGPTISTSVDPSVITVIPLRRSKRSGKRSGLGNTTAVSSPRSRSISTVSTQVADHTSASSGVCFEEASIGIDDDSSGACPSKKPATNLIATSFTTPRSQDVLMGLNQNILSHPGNKHLSDLILRHHFSYKQTSPYNRKEKNRIASTVVNAIHQVGGRLRCMQCYVVSY